MGRLFTYKFKRDAPISLLILIFGIIYCLIALLNHHNFSFNTIELGEYNQALWDYSHFKWHYGPFFSPDPQNILSQDFDLYLMIFSPLVWIGGSYTLIIIQIIAILMGGLGIYKYLRVLEASNKVAFFAALHFFLFFGVYSALIQQYQSFAVAAMLLPWLLYFFHQEKYKTAVLFYLLMIVANENISLWLVLVFGGFIFNYYKDRRATIILIELLLISFAYYLVVTEVAMPWFSDSNKQQQFEYSGVGESFLKSIGWIIGHPRLTMEMMVLNHLDIPGANYVKIELIALLLISGAFMFIIRPQYLLMLIPLFFNKLLSDNHELWGASGLYTIAFGPVITIGLFKYISELWTPKQKFNWSFIFVILAAAATLFFVFKPSDQNKALQIYRKDRYHDINKAAMVQKMLDKLPDTASLSVPPGMFANASVRENVYIFPNIKKADFVFFSEKRMPDWAPESYDTIGQQLVNSNQWEIVDYYDGHYMLKRNNP
ncbi:MAG: DUF2079 domain-containing protein [Bacteroidales bacterium]|nr:DUF2079 domain-containing protein [Bacteroidales bacterium]MCF8344638.1 DUF2079 domain-containing protein [Bacteroidales bacterium]MCF8349562.1 DUF2079 domain-containing protein [Bacteroidales bacterium]MCF8375121.1 DUF2079 domain-containing protein [Bacteroidales bacterium]MCF8400028.1 DUF2079 domain-containing protein [Bacteroidales bacterium]